MDKLRNRSGAAAPRAPGARPEPAAGGAERGSVTRTAAVPGGGKPGEGLVLMFGAPGDPREWVKVANSLLALVASGGLRAGDPLPAMGTLAGEHDVNVGTVARAFRALAASGVIWRVPGLGYYVERKITVDV